MTEREIEALRKEIDEAQRAYLTAKFEYHEMCERLLSMPDSERIVRQVMGVKV
jgi:hypothetical protein